MIKSEIAFVDYFLHKVAVNFEIWLNLAKKQDKWLIMREIQ
jgi:hypothetical protein